MPHPCPPRASCSDGNRVVAHALLEARAPLQQLLQGALLGLAKLISGSALVLIQHSLSPCRRLPAR